MRGSSGRCGHVKGSHGKAGASERILWQMWACEMITEKLEHVKGLLEGVK